MNYADCVPITTLSHGHSQLHAENVDICDKKPFEQCDVEDYNYLNSTILRA